MFGTLAAWRAYATARGNMAPTTATDADALAALVRASDHIQFAYVSKFISGYDSTAPNVEPATYEAASFELTTPGFWSAVFTPAQQKVLTRVGALGWTPIGSADSGDAFANATPTSTKVAAMLAPYMPGLFRIGLSSVGPSNA